MPERLRRTRVRQERRRLLELAWFRRHRRIVLAAVIVLAAAIRVTSFFQLNASPLVEMDRWRESDMHAYDAWARTIASGDWLSASVRVPMHSWHHGVARQYFAEHPDVRLEIERAAAQQGRDADELLWSRWMHLPQFYQDPLYAYLVALTYRVAGPDARYVLVWQGILGILSIVLIWQLTLRAFGETTAAGAALLAVLSGPLTFYELLLLRDTLIVFTGLLLIWLMQRALDRGGWMRFGILGTALGLGSLLKSTFILLAAGVVAMMILRARGRWRTVLAPAAAVAAGFAIGVAPLAARNAALGVPPFALAGSGPLTLVASNDSSYLPEVGFGINTPLLARFLGETSGGWKRAIAESLPSHTVASYAGLVWGKWDRVWHWYEIPNNENYYYVRREVTALGWLPVTFAFLAPLALAGLLLAARRWRDAWPLYLLVTATLVPMVLFYVLARFRVPLVAAAVPFAAYAIVELLAWIEAGRYARSACAAGCVALLSLWTGRPLAPDQHLIRMADWILPYSAYYQPRISTAVDAKDWKQAGAWYVAFFKRYEPTDAEIAASNDRALVAELADMHVECAQILKLSGQTALAAAQLHRADELQRLPGFPN